MLKKRIIPTLLWKNLGLVKGKKFDSWRRVGSVLPSKKSTIQEMWMSYFYLIYPLQMKKENQMNFL